MNLAYFFIVEYLDNKQRRQVDSELSGPETRSARANRASALGGEVR